MVFLFGFVLGLGELGLFWDWFLGCVFFVFVLVVGWCFLFGVLLGLWVGFALDWFWVVRLIWWLGLGLGLSWVAFVGMVLGGCLWLFVGCVGFITLSVSFLCFITRLFDFAVGLVICW